MSVQSIPLTPNPGSALPLLDHNVECPRVERWRDPWKVAQAHWSDRSVLPFPFGWERWEETPWVLKDLAVAAPSLPLARIGTCALPWGQKPCGYWEYRTAVAPWGRGSAPRDTVQPCSGAGVVRVPALRLPKMGPHYQVVPWALLSILQQPKWEKNLKRIDTHICIPELLCYTLGITQHC